MYRFSVSLVIWFASLVASTTSLVPAGAQTLENTKGQDPLTKEIAGAIRRLGSDSFQEREVAQLKLRQIGKAAEKQLEEAEASRETNLETKRRVAALLQELRK